MKVVWGFDDVPQLRHGVATVGSYDGVHRGHRILIDEVIGRAKLCGGESVVITFEPHPRITLGKADSLQLLSLVEEKRILLEQLGVNYMVIIPFDKAFSQLSHEEFINDYLVARLNLKELIVGYNHRFGHNTEGNYSYLSQHDTLKVVEVAQFRFEGEKVSSTTIRRALEEGDTTMAMRLLGHPYIIIGKADERGAIVVDSIKQLPVDGEYNALVNGEQATISIQERVVKQNKVFSQEVKIELL